MCSRSSWSARQCRFLRLMQTPSSVRAVSIEQDASDRTALWSSTIAAGSAAYASADIARSKLEGSRNTTGSGGRLPNTGALQQRSRNDRAWTVLKRLPRSCTPRVQNAWQSTGRNATVISLGAGGGGCRRRPGLGRYTCRRGRPNLVENKPCAAPYAVRGLYHVIIGRCLLEACGRVRSLGGRSPRQGHARSFPADG